MVAKTVTAQNVDELIRRKFALEDMRSRMFGVGLPVQHVDICVPNVADFEAIAQAVERTPTARFRREDGPDALCIEYGCCTFWCDVHNRRTVGRWGGGRHEHSCSDNRRAGQRKVDQHEEFQAR